MQQNQIAGDVQKARGGERKERERGGMKEKCIQRQRNR